MAIDNVLAGVAVRNLDAAAKWYGRLLAHEGNRPMKEVAEWQLPRGGCLQVFADERRAGKSSVTLTVSDIDEQLATLEKLGVEVGDITNTSQVRTAIVKDPDGNQVVFAQALGDAVVK